MVLRTRNGATVMLMIVSIFPDQGHPLGERRKAKIPAPVPWHSS